MKKILFLSLLLCLNPLFAILLDDFYILDSATAEISEDEQILTDLLNAGLLSEELLTSPGSIDRHTLQLDMKIRTEHVYRDSQFTTHRLRYALKYKAMDAGFTIDRDPAEKVSNTFLSAYLQYHYKPATFLVGNYRLNWGLGILHAPAFSRWFSRSATATFGRSRTSLKPYTGASETGFLKGCALQLEKNDISLLSWYSKTNTDYQETLLGSALSCRKGIFSSGFCVERTSYTFSDSASHDTLNINAFSLVSSLSTSRFSAQGEYAFAQAHSALALSLQYGGSRFRNVLFFRNYGDSFPQLHGSPLSRKTDFAGEKGIYYGFTWKLMPEIKLDCYSDLWDFAPRSQDIDLPATGNEQMLNLEIDKNDRTLLLFLRHRLSEKNKALADSSKIVPVHLLNLKTSWLNSLPDIDLKSELNYRYESCSETSSNLYALAVYQQGTWKPGHLQFWFRLTAFYCRIPLYIYENNITGQASQICLTGDGLRIAGKIKYSFSAWQLETKYFYQKTASVKYGISLSIACHLKK